MCAKNDTHIQFFFEENVRYLVWTCRDPISLILEAFLGILGTRFSILKYLKKNPTHIYVARTGKNRVILVSDL